jgi:RNA-directed DNA polymerase
LACRDTRRASRRASIKAAAEAAFSGPGRWFCSNHPGLTRAYPPACFSAKLVSLATRWDELNTNVQASGQLLLPL